MAFGVFLREARPAYATCTVDCRGEFEKQCCATNRRLTHAKHQETFKGGKPWQIHLFTSNSTRRILARQRPSIRSSSTGNWKMFRTRPCRKGSTPSSRLEKAPVGE